MYERFLINIINVVIAFVLNKYNHIDPVYTLTAKYFQVTVVCNYTIKDCTKSDGSLRQDLYCGKQGEHAYNYA